MKGGEGGGSRKVWEGEIAAAKLFSDSSRNHPLLMRALALWGRTRGIAPHVAAALFIVLKCSNGHE